MLNHSKSISQILRAQIILFKLLRSSRVVKGDGLRLKRSLSTVVSCKTSVVKIINKC